jgi:serine/threonine-protein kinase
VDGGTEAEQLIISDLPRGPAVGVGVRARGVASWSPDSRFLAYVEQSGRGDADIWVLSLDDNRQSRPLLQTRFDEAGPRFSPDGRWLAYVSNETGNDEVYLQAFPGLGQRKRVSSASGTLPVWAPDGRELFYVSRGALMAVAVTDTPSFAVGTPRRLFDFFGEWPYDVSRDGRRFLMIQSSGQAIRFGAVNVVVEWFSELRQRMAPP